MDVTLKALTRDEAAPTGAKANPALAPGWFDLESFEFNYRVAKALSATDLVPPQYRQTIQKRHNDGTPKGTATENPSGLPNTMIALTLARRLNVEPLFVMQSLVLVEGRIGWTSQWIAAQFMASGRYSEPEYRITKLGKKTVQHIKTEWVDNARSDVLVTEEIEDMEFVAYVTNLRTGKVIEGPPVTIEMAVKEGWYSKRGSKWPTMPELMGRYRSVTFLGRVTINDRLLGMPTYDELLDVVDVQPDGTFELKTAQDLRAGRQAATQPASTPTDEASGTPTVEPASSPAETPEPTQAPTPATQPQPATLTEPPGDWTEAKMRAIEACKTLSGLSVLVASFAEHKGTEAHQTLVEMANARRAEIAQQNSSRPQPPEKLSETQEPVAAPATPRRRTAPSTKTEMA